MLYLWVNRLHINLIRSTLMKHLFTSVALVALTLTAFSCKGKEDTPQPVPTPTPAPTKISAPFIGQRYISVAVDGDEQYRYLLELKEDGTIDYQRMSDAVTEKITGKYTYDEKTGRLAFSEVASSSGKVITPKDLYFDNVRYDSGRDIVELVGNATYLNTTKAIVAPFSEKTYAVTYLSEDKATVYRKEITLHFDGTLTGIDYAGDEAEHFTGKYTYDEKTHALTFSELKLGDAATTAEELYLDQGPKYLPNADELFLGGSNYQLSSHVAKLQPEAPAHPSQPETPSPVTPPAQPAPEQPSQPTTPPASGAPAFIGKVYGLGWVDTQFNVPYRETYVFKADGTFLRELFQEGNKIDGAEGKYTYDKETHKIVFSDVIVLLGTKLVDDDLKALNENAQYVVDKDQFYIEKSYYTLAN